MVAFHSPVVLFLMAQICVHILTIPPLLCLVLLFQGQFGQAGRLGSDLQLDGGSGRRGVGSELCIYDVSTVLYEVMETAITREIGMISRDTK